MTTNSDEAEVAELETRILRQEALIERLTAAGTPVDKASDRLLQMQLLLRDMRGQGAGFQKTRPHLSL